MDFVERDVCPLAPDFAHEVRWIGSSGRVSLVVPSFGVFDGLHGQGLEFGDEFLQATGVVEPGPVALLLVRGEVAGDGLAVGAADPAQVGPVQEGRVGLAMTAGAAASGGAPHDASGQREVDVGQFGEDLASPASCLA
jgi:hypothetical protein